MSTKYEHVFLEYTLQPRMVDTQKGRWRCDRQTTKILRNALRADWIVKIDKVGIETVLVMLCKS
jgi:hypothetical protein